MPDELYIAINKFYENYKGASDLRTPAEKAKDFLQTEFVASAAPVEWKEKKEADWRSFPIQQQFFTSKCVAFTTAKLALINYWLKTKENLLFSPNTIYDYRSNKPSEGMVGDDAFSIWRDKGIGLEAVAPSNQTQEGDPFSISLFAKEVAKGFKLGNWITIPEKDFDRVASTIQTTGKGIMGWFFFTSREWSPQFPIIKDSLSNPYVSNANRHSVSVTDFGLIGGKQYLRIEDSAKFGNINVRYVSREFFQARNFLSKYPMSFNYEEGGTVIEPTLPKPRYDGSVVSLQNCLKFEGLFPTNVDSTGVFGPITTRAVKDFQKKWGIEQVGIVGPKTTKKLKELYP